MYPGCLFIADVVSGMFYSVVANRRQPNLSVLPCINVFFWHFGILFSSGRESFLVLSAPWHAGSPPGHHGASLGPGRGPWHVLGGSKWQIPTGSDSEHVQPSRPMQTHVQVKRMSDGSCDIRDLECHQCRQTILTW